MLPQLLQIFSPAGLAYFQQNIMTLDLLFNLTLVTLQKEGQINVLAIDEETQCVLLQRTLNFFNA